MFKLTQRRSSGAKSAVLAATAAFVVALTVAGCSDNGDGSTGDDSTAEATQAASGESGPAEVPDVTHLILQTALQNLEFVGLETEVVDESGATVTVDDATAYTVTEQDPAGGETLDAGTTVTLTVAPRG